MLSVTRFYFGYVFLLFIVFGCTYTPSGGNFHEVEIPTPPLVSINLSNSQSDTLDIPEPVLLTYTVLSPNIVNSVQIFLNGELFEERTSISDNKIYIHPNELSDGLHTLEIIAFVKTSSGSLADNLDLEQFVYIGTWFLRIDKLPPNTVEFTNIKKDNTGLTLSWEKYDRANFLNYQINLHTFDAPYEIFATETVSDPDATSIVFSDYIGQKLRVSISVNTNYGVSTSEQVVSESKTIEFYPVQNNENDFTISWNMNQFPENFGSYTIYTNSIGNTSFSRQIYTSPNIEDTSFTFDHHIFVGELEFQLKVRPQETGFFSRDITRVIKYSNTEASFTIPPDGNIYSLNNDVLVTGNGQLSIYSTINNNQIRSRSLSNGSKSLNSIIASTGINTFTGIIHDLNVEDLSTERSISVQALTGINDRVLKLKASLNSTRAIFSSDKVYLIDYDTWEILATELLPRDLADLDISADGNLIYIDKNIYAYESGELVLVRNSNTNRRTYFSNTGDIYYEVDQGADLDIYTYDYKDRNPINRIEIENFRNRKIYFGIEDNVFLAPGYYAGDTSNDISSDLLLISPSEGLKRNIQIYNINALFYYLDNMLYSSDGIKLEVQLD